MPECGVPALARVHCFLHQCTLRFFHAVLKFLAISERPCQSSCLYSFSERLPWSFVSNSFTRQINEKRKTGATILDLTISNPTVALPDYPHSAIADAYANIDDFAYSPLPCGLEEARLAIAGYYLSRNREVFPSQVLVTASTSEAYSLLFKLFCNPENEILAPVPSYPLFEYLAALESVRTVPYRLSYDGSWFIDFLSLREHISDRTRAIIVVNPNNPTGSFLKTFEIQELLGIAQQHNLPIISDEVFMDYAFGNPADPVTTLIGHDSVLSFSLNGLSKLACMPQMKLGWIVINGPTEERELARQRLELILDTYLSVSTPVQRALPRLLSIGAEMRRQMEGRIAENFNALHRILRNSPAHPLHAEGGWSAIIQLPKTLSEETWIARILTEQDVLVQPGYFFDLIQEPCIVVSLITPPKDFVQGIARVRELVC